MTPRGGAWRGPLIAAALALVYATLLLSPGSPYDLDRASFFLPYNRILRDAVASGRLPLWSPQIWGGYAVHAEGQGGFCSPLRWVGALAADEVGALDLELAALLILAALAGAWGARLLLEPGPQGEAMAGVAWSLGGGMLAVQENTAMVGSFLVLPLAWGLAARGRYVTLGLALTWAILAGYPYGPALIVLTAAPVAWWSAPRPLRGLALSVGLAALLGAVQWLPTAELLLHSDRWGGLGDEQRRLAEVGFGDLRWLVSPWVPGAVRHSADSGLLAYLGAPLLALAGWGAWQGRREAWPRGCVALALGALSLALLLSSPLGGWVARLPGVGMVRGPNKLYFLLGGAVAMLAARAIGAPRRAWQRWALVALVALDLGSYGLRRAVTVPRDALRRRPVLAETCAGGRVYVGQVPLVWGHELPSREADVAAFLAQASPLDANHGVRWGVTHLAGYGPLSPARAVRAWSAPGLGLLRRAGADYYVTRPGVTPPSPALPVLASGPRWTLCAVEGSAAPARAVAAVEVVASQPEALAALEAVPAGRVLLEGPAEAVAGLRGQAPGSAGSVTVTRWEPGWIELDVNLSRPGVVVVMDAWFPGWRARVDGETAPLLVADALWKAVPVSPGQRRLELVYRPASVGWGLALSALGLLGLLAVTLRRRAAAVAAQSVDDGSTTGLGSPPRSDDEPSRGADDDPHP